MQVLRSRLYELELESRCADTAELEANKADISFGLQIRNYVCALSSCQRSRTKLERGDVDAALAGDLTTFIQGVFYFCAERHDDQIQLLTP